MPIPREEIKLRIAKLSEKLKEAGIDAALIRYPLHIFYLSGTFTDGHLIITQAQDTYLLVYRTIERARKEALLADIIPFRSLRKLPDFLRDLGINRLGIEYDRVPVKIFTYYQKLLSRFEFLDISHPLWELRACKSPYEIQCHRGAACMLAEALDEFIPKLRPGMTELEAAGLLEAMLRKRGHPAMTRTYGWNQELAYGHLLSGYSAAVPSYITTGQGGSGIYGYPQGPSMKRIEKNEPILVDYAGWYEGYMIDQTRIFVFGSLPKELLDLYQKILVFMNFLEESLKPGVIIEELYQKALNKAEDLGIKRYLMAHGAEGVNFIGHGVGLEIDEWPPITDKIKHSLKPGMVIALEPKCHLRGIGIIGLEDTFLITDKGVERLTLYPRDILFLN